MKVLWIEDHEPVRDMLAVAADKAARARVQVDLVLAHTLMEAERRLRLERFDLVITELTLPDSYDGDMTIARLANMGSHRIAVASANPDRDTIVETALRCGCNIAKAPIFKASMPYNRFIQRPEAMLDFFFEQMPAPDSKATGRIVAA
ncbi:MAG TPA: response regulator [Henriciella marina]|uniref:response regulator n=1 Tax=Henriciella sp. TaxID=1968823 RepID=UPI001791A8E6|nr:response regulator [Henriciella sp.]HIG21332.1 response regulator [Henriciella sp.]HIK65369.1 response regulator [Henriciella marina]